MDDLKSETVLFLTKERGTERDREAAKLLAKCDVEALPLAPGRDDEPALDVLVHGGAEVLNEIRTSGHATQIEDAIRRASGSRVRDLQWVEDASHSGPRNGTAGDGRGQSPTGDPKNPGDPPKFDHNLPGMPAAPPRNRGTPPQDNPTGLRKGGG